MRPMRLAPYLLALALLVPAASAQGDAPALQGLDRHQEPGFLAVAALISDTTFFERWERPEPPTIRDDTRYARGERAYPVLIFQTDAVNDAGHAELTYDLIVTRPDGSPYGGSPYRGLPAWSGGPTPGLVLAQGQAALVIEEDDPLGVYGVEVVLHDRVRGRSFPLALSFEVTE